MSWSGDSENNTQFSMAAVSKWKSQVTKIEQTLYDIRQLIDSTNRDFQIIKHRHSEVKILENSREKLNTLFRQLDKEISELESQLSTDNSQNLNAQKIKIKELRAKAADLTKNFRDLCTNINSELKTREMQRKKEISIISNEFDLNEDQLGHAEQITVSDSLLKDAEEEQRQMDKISRDLIKLEEMFVKLSNMVEEQGQNVSAIECNVAEAFTKVELGEKELYKANVYKRSAMRKKLCIIGIVAAVLLVLALIIGLAVGFDYDEENKQHNEQMTIDESQLRELQEEQRQMEKINQDVVLLEDLFIRLNSMIEEQGEHVNNISLYVEDAYDNVDAGNKQLDQAVDYKRSALKKKICIIGIVIAVLAALGLIIGLSVGLKK